MNFLRDIVALLNPIFLLFMKKRSALYKKNSIIKRVLIQKLTAYIKVVIVYKLRPFMFLTIYFFFQN